MTRFLRRFELGILRVYQAWSATRIPRCRFMPSCSVYAVEALQVHGLLRAHQLIVKRILRCRPGGGRGFDPVPSKASLAEPCSALPQGHHAQ